MLKTLSTRLSLGLAALGAAGLLAACGDNLSPGGGGPDAANIDASLIDASNNATVGSTIAVTDVTVADPEAAALGGISGGAISIGFSDLTMNGGEVVFGTSPIGGCVLTQFDADSLPNPPLDTGPVTITGDGLLKTVGTCTFQAAFNQYVCISNTATDATVAATDAAAFGAASATAYTFPGVDFGMAPAVNISTMARATNAVTVVTATPHGLQTGTFVTIAGATPASFNTPAAGPGFPVNVINATTFAFGQAGADEAATTPGTAAQPLQRIVTSALNVNGFAETDFNSGASAFPILLQLSANTVLTGNPTPGDNVTETATTITYNVLNGFTPVPHATVPAPLFNFLGDETGDVTISKPDDDNWPALDQTVYVRGQGYALDDDSDDPAAFDFANAGTDGISYGCAGMSTPLAITAAVRATNEVTATAAGHGYTVGQLVTVAGMTPTSFNATLAPITAVTATTFTYDSTGADEAATAFGTSSVRTGNCGADASTAPLEATIISGRATRGDLTGLLPFQMPTEVPGTDTWMEWQCAYLLSDTATMPAEAAQAIIDFNPTRVEMRVLRVSGALIDGDGVNQMRLLVGHGLVGHQDPP